MTILALLTLGVFASLPATASDVGRPIILSLSSHRGPMSGGQRIDIVGAQFVQVRKVVFGTRPGASVKVISTSLLSVVVPAHSPGAINIRVITAYGASKTPSASRFIYVASTSPPPLLDGAMPAVNIGALPTAIIPSSWAGPNPSTNCVTVGSQSGEDLTGIVGLDYCGATLEGLAPLPLPSNWSSLSDPQRGFVLMNLERIERGETPIIGVSTTLDTYAAEGADANTDPPVSFITDGVGGSIWDGGNFVTWGMVGFLYYDGPGGINLDCTTTNSSGCWGHRDNILDGASNPSLAVGVADGPSGDAAAVFSDQFADINFSWTNELTEGYPLGLPSSFVLATPSITQFINDGNGMINLTGTSLDTVTTVYFSNIVDTNQMRCTGSNHCEIQVPTNLSPNTTYNVYLLNSAGLSVSTSNDRFTAR